MAWCRDAGHGPPMNRPDSQRASARVGEKLVAQSARPSITAPFAAVANPDGAPSRNVPPAPVLGATGCAVSDFDESLPNLDCGAFARPTAAHLAGVGASTHAPRFLMLYGSLARALVQQVDHARGEDDHERRDVGRLWWRGPHKQNRRDRPAHVRDGTAPARAPGCARRSGPRAGPEPSRSATRRRPGRWLRVLTL
jgi:hypothetical protein